ALPTANLAPVFDSTPVIAAAVGQPYVYHARAHDPDGSTLLTYLLYSGPAGMAVDPASGDVTWSPTAQALANSPVVLYVYGGGAPRSAVGLGGGTHARVTGALAGVVQRAEGHPRVLPIPATDADGDPLVYWVDNLPGGASFDPTLHALLWTPGYTQAGTYNNVLVHVSDGKSEARASLTILVTPTDPGPALKPVPDRTLREGDRVHLFLSASDPKGSTWSYTADGLPAGATLNPNAGLVDWTAGFAQAGTYPVIFHATSGGKTADQTATFTVLNANAAPVFDPLPSW